MEDFTEGRVTVSLLHPTMGHPIQHWRFQDQSAIRIGRAEDNDVAIADQHVSRYHAELKFARGVWELKNLGRNGTVLNGRNIEASPLGGEVVFQLGSTGPTLQFRRMDAVLEESTTERVREQAVRAGNLQAI